MTVENSNYRISYNGDGSTVAFSIPFYFIQNADILVTKLDTNADPNTETTFVLGTDYTLTGAGDVDGGTLTTIATLITGEQITIERNVAFTQSTDLEPYSKIPAETVEQVFDKLTMLTQQVKALTDRAFLLDKTTSFLNRTVDEPTAGDFLKYDANGNIINGGTSVTASQNYTYPDADAVQRTVANKLDEIISVKDFGATGDGVTDDTTAIQNAIDAAASKILFFPKGTYICSSGLTISVANVTFVGEGRNASLLDFADTAYDAVTADGGTAQGFSAYDISFGGGDESAPTLTSLIKLSGGVSRVNLKNVNIGSSVKGIHMTECYIVKILNGNFSKGLSSIHMEATATGITDVLIDGCTVGTNTSGGTLPIFNLVQTNYTRVTNCYFETELQDRPSILVGSGSNSVTIQQNTFNDSGGVRFDGGAELSLANNNFYLSYTNAGASAGDKYVIRLSSGLFGTVSGNVINGTAAGPGIGTNYYGIYSLANMNILGNTIRNCDTGIRSGRFVGHNTLASCNTYIESVASQKTGFNMMEQGGWYISTQAFTPVVAGSGTAGSPTYNSRVGRYVALGNLCWFTLKIDYSNLVGSGGAGNLIITGLPFTSVGTDQISAGLASVGVNIFTTNITFAQQLVATVPQNTSQVNVNEIQSASALAAVGVDDAGIIWVSGVYEIDN